MGIFADEIKQVCEQLKVKYSELPLTEGNKIRSTINTTFDIDTSKKSMWEGMQTTFQIYNPEGWRQVSGFFKKEPLYFLFDISTDKNVLIIHDSDDLTDVLGESTGFVFYVSDMRFSSLVCFNDHNVLLANVKPNGLEI